MKEDGCNFINEQGDLCFAQTIVNENGVTNTIITILEQKSENIGLVPETVFETNIVKYDNFYIKAPIEMLEVPIPLPDFLNGEEYMTIPEYLIKNSKSEVKYFTLDGKYFIKGFNFNLAGLDTLRDKLIDFGLELGTNIWILSPNEAKEELFKLNIN